MAKTTELASEQLYGMTAELRGGFPDIPLPADIDLAEFTEAERFFVTLPIMPVGARSRNERTYSRAAVESIVRQINENRPEGFWGHLPVHERATRYDPPAVRWLAAKIDQNGMAWGKLIATREDAREHLRMAKKTNAKVGTSIRGWTAMNGDTVTEVELESIDLADPARVGILESVRQPVISAEMTEVTAEMEGDSDMEQIAELTGQRDQLQEQVATLTARAAELEQRVTAYEQAVAEMDALKTRAAELETQVAEYEREVQEFRTLKARDLNRQIDDAVAEAVKVDALRPLVRGMVNGAESIDTAKARIEEIVGSEFYIAAAEKIVQAEMGPGAVVPPKPPVKDGVDMSPDAVRMAREKHGI